MCICNEGHRLHIMLLVAIQCKAVRAVYLSTHTVTFRSRGENYKNNLRDTGTLSQLETWTVTNSLPSLRISPHV